MPSPSIQLSSDLAIGYDSPIARTTEPVTLAGGTHFLLARNGRGKTTLLRTLSGTLKSLSGAFKIEGHLQYLPEDLRFDPEITPKTVFNTLIPKARRKDALDLASRIELDVKKPYGRLSTGNRRKTSLIVAEFSIRPGTGNLLLLDEPFSGLDAFARHAFEEIWRSAGDHVLRLVSCHPDYESMAIPSALLIEGQQIHHLTDAAQTWHSLKPQLN